MSDPGPGGRAHSLSLLFVLLIDLPSSLLLLWASGFNYSWLEGVIQPVQYISQYSVATGVCGSC